MCNNWVKDNPTINDCRLAAAAAAAAGGCPSGRSVRAGPRKANAKAKGAGRTAGTTCKRLNDDTANG
ncbi:unnamed protein product [Nippostrongylus brasiliensis]|uniref:Uncharacterized protein n=1 Tax=Nippostrongylus brasiliensis TaxID=27835 RepID=A0A0N4Y0G9_NIPBR|nr:hypothetical protein Q1695_013261 [Nippostrongylus brasiliensis]VDL72609.1 unnamed protein product [Nippostrongylus brasiliensis]